MNRKKQIKFSEVSKGEVDRIMKEVREGAKLRQLIRKVQKADPIKRGIENKYGERLISLAEMELKTYLVRRRVLTLEEIKEIISSLSRRTRDFILTAVQERIERDKSGQECLMFLEEFSTEFGEKGKDL